MFSRVQGSMACVTSGWTAATTPMASQVSASAIIRAAISWGVNSSMNSIDIAVGGALGPQLQRLRDHGTNPMSSADHAIDGGHGDPSGLCEIVDRRATHVICQSK